MSGIGEHVGQHVPEWVPVEVVRYLEHVEAGRSIRSIAREAGCHASTILRQVRRYETRRDDLLVDLALKRLGEAQASNSECAKFGESIMTPTLSDTCDIGTMPNDAEIQSAAPHILRRLNEQGACLAIAADMDKAVIARDTPDGRTLRTVTFERTIAEALALKNWIAPVSEGRITRYKITAAGRLALKGLMAKEEGLRVSLGESGDLSSEQQRDLLARSSGNDTNKRRGMRYNVTESPLVALSRRKDKDGKPFLSQELVAAGERLREDFELSQMGRGLGLAAWDNIAIGDSAATFPACGEGGLKSARDRVALALSDLGPGLGDVVLRCCCFLEGMEAVERRMGWSARSGKIVLRIALMRLNGHYNEKGGNWSPMIG